MRLFYFYYSFYTVKYKGEKNHTPKWPIYIYIYIYTIDINLHGYKLHRTHFYISCSYVRMYLVYLPCIYSHAR